MNIKPKYVYLISAEGYGPFGFLKVGVSCDYASRIKHIQNHTPFPVCTIVVVMDSDPLSLESKVLNEFKTHRIRGEWLYVSPSESIDCSKCSHRDFMSDLGVQSRKLKENIKNYIINNSDMGAVDALF